MPRKKIHDHERLYSERYNRLWLAIARFQRKNAISLSSHHEPCEGIDQLLTCKIGLNDHSKQHKTIIIFILSERSRFQIRCNSRLSRDSREIENVQIIKIVDQIVTAFGQRRLYSGLQFDWHWREDCRRRRGKIQQKEREEKTTKNEMNFFRLLLLRSQLFSIGKIIIPLLAILTFWISNYWPTWSLANVLFFDSRNRRRSPVLFFCLSMCLLLLALRLSCAKEGISRTRH